eukprot:Phypoly_transcript_01705.p1 GENE.Phypoly_transcript_01705~~Phypoly_transcript_01705.p1  ORF type:complete len:1035 (+),score=140.85 Phypoly_transcript_01705:73-3177(+)
MGNFLPSRFYHVTDKRPEICTDEVVAFLSSYVIGQGEALRRIQDLLIAAKDQPLSPAPHCTMLFLGPSNMGKTPTCKALAKFVYGSEDDCYRINFKEFTSPLYIDKLKSTFAQIAKGPGKVVILYDLDAAHESALEIVKNIITGSQNKLNFSGCIFAVIISTKDSSQAQELNRLESTLGHSSLATLSQNIVPFHALQPLILPAIVQKAWEKLHSDVLRNVDRENSEIKLTAEEAGDIVERFFNEQGGWMDRPCHLTRYLSMIMMEKIKLSGRSRVRFGSAAPRYVAGEPHTSAEEEDEAPSRKRKNQTESGNVKKTKFSSNSAPCFSESINKQSDNTHSAMNSTQSNNTTTSNSHNSSLKQSQAEKPANTLNTKFSKEQEQNQSQFDISPLVDRPLYLFVPPDNLPETARFQRGFAIASADDSPFVIKPMNEMPTTVAFSGKGNNDVPGFAYIENKKGNLRFGNKRDAFRIEKFKRGVAVKHRKNYIGLKPDLNFGIQDKPFEFVLDYNFAPVRSNTNIEFFVDGEGYFARIYDEITSAETSIYIFDWMFSHETHLIRPLSKPDHELGELLLQKARQGVTVHILLYKNIESIVPNNHKEAVERFKGIDNIHMALQGCNVVPVISRWSHHQKGVVIDHKRAYIGGLDLAHNRWDTQEHRLCEVVPGHHPGQDYRNPFIEKVERNQHPRMPWHDVQVGLDGEAAHDVAINFVQRWNANDTKLKKQITNIPAASPGHGNIDCQITRSMRSFYCGEFFNEKSIRNAYIDAISSAKSFVYIESQYFIENTETPDARPIINALCARIARAKGANEPFTVVVILPQLPDNGNPEKSDANLIMKYQFAAIQCLRSEISLITFNPEEYINFYTLRNHQLLDYGIVTEAIYVHAKLMITDDICIVGSANLNDRSMSGTKDSEIAAVVFSAEKSRELLLKLVSEHSAITQEPEEICQFFRGPWKDLAKNNTAVYKEVFGFAIADGEAPSFCLYERGKTQKPNEHAQTNLHGIKGHLVMYPYNFLMNELQNFNISQYGLDKSELCL